MVQISSQEKYRVVSNCILGSYQRQVEVLDSFSNNNYTKKHIRRSTLWSTVNYLRSDLANIELKLQKILNSNISCEEEVMLADYANDLSNTVNLLEECTDLDIEGLIDNVVTAEYVITQSIIDLLEISSSAMVKGFDYKLLDFVHETGYAFQKFMIFNVSHLRIEDIYYKFKPLSKMVILQLKETLLNCKDKIFLDEFIHYTKCSLQYLHRYLLHVGEIIENQTISDEMSELLSTLYNYIVFHINIIFKAINSGNPINNLLKILGEIEHQQLTTLQNVIHMVELWSSYDEYEDRGLIYHSVLFFAETVQNIISIEDIGKGFQFSRSN